VPPTPAERFPQPEPGGFQPWLAPPREAAGPRGPEPLPSANDVAHASAASLPAPEPEWEETVIPIEPAGKARKKKSIPKERKVSPLLLVLLVLALMAAAIAAGVTYLPGILKGSTSPAPATGERPGVPAPRAAARPAAADAGTPRPYAVYVKAFAGDGGLEAARKLAADVQRKVSGTPAFVFTEEENGIAYHKVYAGILQDTVQGAALRAELLRRDLADTVGGGGPAALIQARPYAFDLGEFATRADADTRADELERGAIDAYTVPVPQNDGTERFRLYVGAFADSARAVPMQKTLEASRLPARLVRRVGRAPATPK
jgi:hypothetical protein